MTEIKDLHAITASDLVIRRLEQHGVEHAFGVAGGAIMYITDALRRCTGIKCTVTHHEQSSAIAAEAYAKLTNKPALLFATAGPGVTNSITGVADAYMDSVPMLVLLGDVRSTIASDFSKQRYNAPQEVDQYALMRPIVKEYAYIDPGITDQDLVSLVDACIFSSTSGRPGPVCIALPLDVQGRNCDPTVLYHPIKSPPSVQCKNTGLLREAMLKLLNSKRPLILLGSGVRISGMTNAVKQLISETGLPWCVTIGAVDLQDYNSQYSCGCVGPTSQRAANTIFQKADCILALGTSFDQSVTGFNIYDLLRSKIIFLVNIDSGESLRFDTPNINFIEASVADFLGAIDVPELPRPDWRAWLDQIFRVRSLLTPQLESALRTSVGEGYLSAYDITEEISKNLSSSATVVLGISLDAHTVFNCFRVIPGQRIIVSRNLGPMGWDVPGLLGAALATNDIKNLVLITGDGSLMLNVQELAILAGLQIPACIFVFSNDGYSSIRTTQSNFFGSDYLGCNLASGLFIPPVEALARGFGFQYDKLSELKQIQLILENHYAHGLPRLVECCLDPAQLREPRLVSKVVDGKFLTPVVNDMTPPLPPELLHAISESFGEEKK